MNFCLCLLQRSVRPSLLSAILWLSLTSSPSFAQVDKTIILIGDSITVTRLSFTPCQSCSTQNPCAGGNDGYCGYGNGDQWGWTARKLERLLEYSGDTNVLNYGIAGTQSSSGINRIQSVINHAKAKHPANQYYILILYGTNDMGTRILPAVSSQQTQANILSMITIANQNGVTPIVGTLLPRKDRDVTAYNQAITSAASTGGADLVDHYQAWQGKNLDKYYRDPIHPKKCGSEFIAETWYQVYFKGEPISSLPARLSCNKTIAPLGAYRKSS